MRGQGQTTKDSYWLAIVRNAGVRGSLAAALRNTEYAAPLPETIIISVLVIPLPTSTCLFLRERLISPRPPRFATLLALAVQHRLFVMSPTHARGPYEYAKANAGQFRHTSDNWLRSHGNYDTQRESHNLTLCYLVFAFSTFPHRSERNHVESVGISATSDS